ncbi:MAG TPA: hypothetical protein VFY29_11735, partial [Terriglobia bacterium]|nr:hypothetical protein [Terriglobia bacterium]
MGNGKWITENREKRRTLPLKTVRQSLQVPLADDRFVQARSLKVSLSIFHYPFLLDRPFHWPVDFPFR